MLPFILKRLLNLIPVFLGATFMVFVILQVAPGDFLDARRLDPRTTPATIERLERQFGLDQPIPVQYVRWLANFMQGNLGTSFDSNIPVAELVVPKIGNSAILTFGNTILIFLIGIPIGIYGAVRQYSLGDKTISLISYFFLGFPNFFFGLLVIFGLLQIQYALGRPLFPIGGMTSSNFDSLNGFQQFLDILWHTAMPMMVLLIGDVAGFTRGLRAQMLEYLNQDYVRTARAKGLTERTVIYRHTLRNAITPFVAGIGNLLPAILAGAGTIELLFNWPGLFPVFLESLNSQDIYVTLSVGAISLVLLVVGNLIADFLLAVVDPRIRYF
ncbi:MAG: ABC transporter permease [Pleurocapsa sp. SU_196_0]|nr:ABC transporter permease [Pleurocapsa sp. SU_196_0]